MISIERIVKSGLCTGCGICKSIAPKGSIDITMTTNGYLRPSVIGVIASDTQKKINKVCPGISLQHESPIDMHPLWGPIINVEVGYSCDAVVRKAGSSGGVISALCIYLLESNKVDFIAQVSANDKKPTENMLRVSRTRQDVISAAGSRYSPSSPLADLTDLLERGERFAFVGKPCDVAALRAYLRENVHYKDQIPYILSFMCAGMPSQKATIDVIAKMGADVAKIDSFRYRGDGWPGKARAVHRDGSSYEMDYNSSWGEILGKQLQYRCKICADGTGEFADVVCADAWYGKDGYPDFSERDGRSLILSRTATGNSLLSSARLANVIKSEAIPVEEIAAMQPYQVNRRRLSAARGFATLLAQGITTKFLGFGLLKLLLSAGLIYTVRNAWGTYRRANGE